MKLIMIVLMATVVLGGCTTIDREAFQDGKHYPVLSTYLDRMKNPDQLSYVTGNSRNIEAAYDINDIVDAFSMQFLKGFARNVPFEVTYGDKVTRRAAYKKAGLPKTLNQLGLAFVAPKDYGVHFGFDETQFVKLINDLKEDGGLIIYHHFSMYPSAKKVSIASVVIGYDKTGKKVLQYTNNYDYPIDGYIKGTTIDLQGAKMAAIKYAETAGSTLGKLISKQLE